MPLPPTRKRPHRPDDDTDDSGSGPSSNVKVVVRIRPPNVKEVEGNFREVVQAVDENVLVFDPKEPSSYKYGGGRRKPRDIRQRRNKDLKFAFDHVFDQSATNSDVYNETTNVVLNGLLTGYNCSVFAYGSTGAGKTHTMLGSKEHPGVMYHTMMDLYSRIDNMRDNTTCGVAVSYLEIYNETIRDLLMPGGSLPIREDPGKGVVVPGLSLHKPKTAEELLYMLQFGNKHRTQHPTDANAESSRSHAVLQVFVRQQDRTANISTEVRVAKLCLVDLAGSERATVTKNRGSRFREGANINRSLLALGNVINALAENKNKGYVPYRDSKLTRLLKDSLGGNCQTVMIAAVSPSSMTYEDTYNTLRYADRAKHIKATLKKNVINVDFHMAKYGKIVEELRKEIVELKGKLKQYEDIKMMPAIVHTDNSSFIGYQNEICRVFTGHRSLRCEQIQQEITLRNLQWKMYRKQRCLSRLITIDEPANLESQRKFGTMLNGMKQKSAYLKITSESSRSKLVEGFKHLGELEQSIRTSCVTEENQLPEVLSLTLQLHGAQSDLQDTKQYLGYTKQVIRCQEKELQHNERLIHSMLKLLKRQHHLMKSHCLLTSNLVEEYSAIQQRVAGQEICWDDQEGGTTYANGYTLADMLELPSLGIKPEPFNSEKVPVEQTAVDSNQKPGIFKFTATQQPSNYPYKVVDECSPPKAKRVMLAANQCQQAAVRVDRLRNTQSSSNNYRSVFAPTKSKYTPTKSRSFGDSASQCSSVNSMKNVPKSNVQSNAKLSRTLPVEKKTNSPVAKGNHGRKKNSSRRRSASVGSSIEFETDESPQLEGFSHSRFSRVNDTITKSKKFSKVHTNSTQPVGKSSARRSLIEETVADLDGTFTIDLNANNILPSVIPCVDSVSDKNSSKTAVIITESAKSCQKCASDIKVTSQNIMQKDVCSISEVQPAEKYTSCIDSQTGCHCEYGPENESGTSTIVDQSANSVTSLASISTLVECQNLSQELSRSEECSPDCDPNGSEVRTGISSSENVTDRCTCTTTMKAQINSTNSELNRTVTKSVSAGTIQSEKDTKALRSIKFDNVENTRTPTKGKSYADVVRTPTPERQPLKQVGNCNTPLSSPRCDSRSSFTSSDSEASFDKHRSSDLMSTNKSSRNSEEHKENFRILSQLGLPSLVSDSIIYTAGKSHTKNKSFTPGYMQSTKAHLNRKKLNISKNSSLNSSGEEVLKVETTANRVKTSFIAKHARPLSSHMRSKSTSNLSSRSGWQI